MKLSIIIPYYNTERYTDNLLSLLDPQMTDEVEVLLIDDASPIPYKSSYPWLKVIRHRKNKRCSGARNTGIEKSKGEYITFMDSDDVISPSYIQLLLAEIDYAPFDVCDYSWKSLTTKGMQFDYRLRNREDRLPNPSVWCRCFSREFIGDHRFNTNKDSTEDEDFTRHLRILDPTNEYRHTAITEYMYYYRTDDEASKIKKYRKGLQHTKRIVYYYDHVTADMTDLLEDIKVEDQNNEVWLITNQCDIPEMIVYAQISRPRQIWAHELRGEDYRQCTIVRPPIVTQVVVYCEFTNTVGGINTFIYAFCQNMRKYYDITVLYERMPPEQVAQLMKIVRTEEVRNDMAIVCDTLILNRLTDKIPTGITFKRSVQICHACIQQNYHIPQDRDFIVNVSQAAKETWGAESENGIVINNMPYVESAPCLILVSATRLAAFDKGNNHVRMKQLAEHLTAAGIKFLWFCFGDKPLNGMPNGFVNMPIERNIQPYIARADYLVQLSDHEAFPYAVLEALTNNTAVICTPFESVHEIGVVDGKNGYIVPLDMNFDVTKLLNIPEFTFEYDTQKRIDEWRKLLGNTKPSGNYDPTMIRTVKILRPYFDIDLKRNLNRDDIVNMTGPRAIKVSEAGYARIIGG